MKTRYFVGKVKKNVLIWRVTGERINFLNLSKRKTWKESVFQNLEQLEKAITVNEIAHEEMALMF